MAVASDAGLRLPGAGAPFGPARTTPSALAFSNGYGRLPLYFEPNLGQFDSQVRYIARGGGYTMYFTDDAAVAVLRRGQSAERDPRRPLSPPMSAERAAVRMELVGAQRPWKWQPLDKQPGTSNYFLGKDRTKWRTDVPNYGRVEARGVYRGVDLVCYGNQRQLEYDFVIGPGADPKQIQVAYEGVESVEVEASGQLVLRTALGEIRQQQPRVYQEIGGKRVEVEARYMIVAHNRVGFQLAKYDRKREVRIDPVVMIYSTYLSGSGTYLYGIAVDAAGSAYVAGNTAADDFPTQSAYQPELHPTDCCCVGIDATVTKLTPAGDGLVYSTYLGGNCSEVAQGIAVDREGSAYITGYTLSTDFPTQSPFQADLHAWLGNAFVTKLTPAGNALVYSTYLGGSDPNDEGRLIANAAYAVAVDGVGSAYVTGLTASHDFPITQSAYQTTLVGFRDAFVTKMTPSGDGLVYSTYLGGGWAWGNGIAVDVAGSAYITGITGSEGIPTKSAYQSTYSWAEDAFVTKLTPDGDALVYSTYLGGNGSDLGNGIAVDGAGSAYVTGSTSSTDFPTQSAYQATLPEGSTAAFVTKLTPAGNALVYSTYLGGSNYSGGLAIAVDAAGSAHVAGSTGSADFPTRSAYQTALRGAQNAFVATLAPNGNALVYSTYLGGSGAEYGTGIAVDRAGSAYVAGSTTSVDFPTQSPYQGTSQGSSGFVTKLAPFGLSFVPVAPCRIADTRSAEGPFGGPAMTVGSTRSFVIPQSDCGIPATAQAYSLNVTVVPQGRLSYLTLWPSGQPQPLVSTLNSFDGNVVANAAIVSAGAGGAVNVFVADSTDVILDIDGYFDSAAGANSYAFYPAAPCRIADTRNPASAFGGPSMTAGESRDFGIPSSSCGLPAAASAYSLNVTAVPNPSRDFLGYLSTWPAGQAQPFVSTLNSWTGSVVANAAIVPAGTNGSVSVFVTDPTNVILDTNGYFAVPGSAGALSFYPVAPCRVADTRGDNGAFGGPEMGGGSTRSFPIPASGCNIPATAAAYSVNVTVVPEGPLGYLTAWPTGSPQPFVSTLNSFDGSVVANAAIVPAGAGGAISIYVTNPTDVIIDINGYFAP